VPQSFVSGPVRVRVPATSANLGPGFDALGLALTLHDEVTAQVTTGGCRVEVTGEGADELPRDESHLVVRSMMATFDLLGNRPPGLEIRCVNRIPQARGLGSSSAAIVAGVLLARALVADGDQRLDDAAVLRLAADLEGHPDNVAPCLLGGFTIAWTEQADPAGHGQADPAWQGHSDPAGPAHSGPAGHQRSGAAGRAARAVVLAPAKTIRPTVFVPRQRGLTAQARAALPASVPHEDAARNAGRAALLVHALTTDPSLLFPATEDRLHQDYRAPGMPQTAALVNALRAAGVAAVVSGAGPSVLALTDPPREFDPGIDWVALSLQVDSFGAQLDRGTLGHAERDPVAAGRKS